MSLLRLVNSTFVLLASFWTRSRLCYANIVVLSLDLAHTDTIDFELNLPDPFSSRLHSFPFQ